MQTAREQNTIRREVYNNRQVARDKARASRQFRRNGGIFGAVCRFLFEGL